MVASAFGAVVFLSFVLLATHVSLGLYSNSVVNAAAFEAALAVASAPDDQVDQRRAIAESQLRAQLPSDSVPVIEWRTDDEGDIGLAVSVARPNVLPPSMSRAMNLDRTKRTVWVRRETER